MLIAGLCLVGGWLIVTGVAHWLHERAARQAVDAFFHAVREGDRNAALSHLTRQRRTAVEQRSDSAAALFQTPTPGFRWRIRELVIDDDSATAALWIERDGFVLEPMVHLVRTDALTWKIDRFENVGIDSHRDDAQRARRKQQNEQTAAELKHHFQDTPGISVRRITRKSTGESTTRK